MSGRIAPDDLTAVQDRVAWLHLCRAVMLGALPSLAMVLLEPGEVVLRLCILAGVWAVVVAVPAALIGVFAAERRNVVVTAMTAMLLGDGVVLTAGWHLLGGVTGPAGTLLLVYGVAVTLIATFRTGVKMALWVSLLTLLVLDARAAGVVTPYQAFPTRDIVVLLAQLWAAVLATAALAAVNERELRRRRYDEQVLRELALAQGATDGPEQAAGALARFAATELAARRAAVVVAAGPAAFAVVEGPGAAGRTGPQLVRLPAAVPVPDLTADEALLWHHPPASERWLHLALPGATNVVIVPFTAARLHGVLVVEGPARRPRRFSRRLERRMIATARLAAAQSAAAIGQAVAVAELAVAASTDGLTGLANRARFDRVLAERVTGSEPFSVVLVDLDHFKAVNDTYGHQTGDAVLRGVASALHAVGEPGDLVARYGGEEMVVLVSGGRHEGELAAERLRLAVESADVPVPVTATLGMATWPEEERTAAALLEAADRRLYLGKKAGRNRAVTR